MRNADDRRSPLAARRSPLAAAALLLTLQPSWAIDPPVYNPDPDTAGFGSTWGTRQIGDAPPPTCWPSGAPPMLAGPLYRGQTDLHLTRANPGVNATAITAAQSGTLVAPIGAVETLPFTTTVADGTLELSQAGQVSARLRVETPPTSAEVTTPFLTHVPDSGAVAVELRNVFPGATVTAAVAGRTTQTAWNDDGDVVSVRLPPGTLPGETVTLTSTVAGISRTLTTSLSNSGRAIPVAEVPWYAEAGAFHVTVSGVTPGSEVRIEDATGAVLGSAWFGGSYGVVPVCELSPTFRVRVLRGNGATLSALQTALPDPTVIYGSSTPALVQIGGIDAVEYPAAGSTVGVAVICNGSGNSFQDLAPYSDGLDDGYRGYDWLGVFLARRRVHSFSINCGQGVTPPFRSDTTRAFLTALPVARPALAETPQVLIGHSYGGEGVVLAARVRIANGDTLIRGVVALAPSTEAGGPANDAFPLLVMNGDEDSVTSGGLDPFRLPNAYVDARTTLSAVLRWHQIGHWSWNEATPFPFFLAEPGGDSALREAARRVILRFARGALAATDPSGKIRAHLWGGSPARATWSYRTVPWFKDPEVFLVDDFENANPFVNTLGTLVVSPTGSVTEGTKGTLLATALHADPIGIGFVNTTGTSLDLHEAVGTLDLTSRDYVAIDLLRDDVGLLPTSCTLALVDAGLLAPTVSISAIAPFAPFMREDVPPTAQAANGDRTFETRVIPLSAFESIDSAWSRSSVITVRLHCDNVSHLFVDNLRFGSW